MPSSIGHIKTLAHSMGVIIPDPKSITEDFYERRSHYLIDNADFILRYLLDQKGIKNVDSININSNDYNSIEIL